MKNGKACELSKSSGRRKRVTGERRRRGRNLFIKAPLPLTGKLQAIFQTDRELTAVLFTKGLFFFGKDLVKTGHSVSNFANLRFAKLQGIPGA
ncbi:MAG: hypothetical protein J0M10_05215 [Chitinophagales bacterium]|nr:hypothetical protein [Chitinophagales bacterium]